MKAIRVHEFGGPEVMRLAETPDPKPGPGQVLVRIHAAGVNPVDTYQRAGMYPIKPTLPYTPGSDAAGVVEAVGKKAGRFKKGDRVYLGGSITGTYAELALCEAWQVHALAKKLSFAQGSAIHVPYATAYRALFDRAKAKPKEIVLVHGASGGVGSAAVQIARAAGMTVIGTAGTEKGLELAKKEGAHHVFNHKEPDYLAKIGDLCKGKGVDVILEMLANVNLAKDMQLLARDGRIVVIGNRGSIEINPRDIMGKDGAILGMSLMTLPPKEVTRIHKELGKGLASGKLRPIVGRELPLSDAPQGHVAVLEPGAYGKIVLVP